VWIRRLLGLRGVRLGRGGRRDSIRFDAVTLAVVDYNVLHNLDERARPIRFDLILRVPKRGDTGENA
jgi:hypothetical protein